MGRSQYHAGKEGQEVTSEIHEEHMSPTGPYFQLNSPNNFSANQSVVDSNHYT